jgi:hypothetical protein
MKLALGNPNWFELQLDRHHFSMIVRRPTQLTTLEHATQEHLVVPLDCVFLIRCLLLRRRPSSASRNRLNLHHDLD